MVLLVIELYCAESNCRDLDNKAINYTTSPRNASKFHKSTNASSKPLYERPASIWKAVVHGSDALLLLLAFH